MDSTGSSGPSDPLKTGARVAAEGAAVAALGAALLAWLLPGPERVRGILTGFAAAWAASSFSVAWLLWARGRDMRTFWWAFGGGMALRAAVLGALAVWGYRRETVSLDALLISYVFALLALLLSLEFRHLRVK